MPENISGEYSKVQSVSGCFARESAGSGARCDVASSTISSSFMPSTTLRMTGASALYRCMTTRFAPFMASKVRAISGSRAWVSTWIVTSSGTRSSSISRRTKSKSVCDAEGKPTSISLKPMRTSSWNMRSLRAASIGSISAWLPSRRSTLHQSGALVSTASGQVRSVRPTGAKRAVLGGGLLQHDGLPCLCFRNQQPQNAKRPVAGADGPFREDLRARYLLRP